MKILAALLLFAVLALAVGCFLSRPLDCATVAWHPLGWQAWAYAEIDRFPSAVLAHHYPDTPNLGDMTRFKDWPDATVDVLVGGTPCQSFSVAGLRAGLDDPRGSLMLTYLALARRYRPTWLVWENVPGVLSADNGRALGTFLGGLGDIGYGWAYRVLDAQYFGLAQRRARVFVVGCLGDWRGAAAVLFERESLSGDSPPRREAGEVAPTVPARRSGGGGLGTDFDCDGWLIHQRVAGALGTEIPGSKQRCDASDNLLIVGERARALTSSNQRIDAETETLIVAHTLRADGFDASKDGTRRGTPLIAFDTTQITSKANRSHPKPGDPCHPLAAGAHAPAVAFNWQSGGDARGLDPKDTAQLQRCQTPAIQRGMQVRRLTPLECERLQGFPDGYTLVPYRGQPAKDGPRYKALGNSMAVPVMSWIGRRIALVDRLRRAA